MVRSISDAFSGSFVIHQDLTCKPIVYDDLDEMGSWPRFEERELSWANFPAQTSELRKRWYTQQQKDHLQWVIIRDKNNELIGRCSLTQPISGKSVIYGLVIRPDKIGQGLGTWITRIMVRYIFLVTTSDEVNKIWLESRYDNVRAQRTWERVGFIKQGIHMRREVFGRYDRYIGYYLNRETMKSGDFPDLTIEHI